MSADRQQAQPGLSVTTLMIASASSLITAVVVSKLWGPGTLISAAVTPVIVAVVSEGLRRPARAIGTVREIRAARYDPVAEGRRGLREGDLERARPLPAAAAAAQRREQRAAPRRGLRLPRPRVIAAVVTGIAAFALAATLLTGSELVLGKSSVVSPTKRTTLLGGGTDKSAAEDQKKKADEAAKQQQETTPTTTEQAPTTSAPTESQPSATTPAPPPDQTAAPPQSTTPAPPTAPPTQAPPGAPGSSPPTTVP